MNRTIKLCILVALCFVLVLIVLVRCSLAEAFENEIIVEETNPEPISELEPGKVTVHSIYIHPLTFVSRQDALRDSEIAQEPVEVKEEYSKLYTDADAVALAQMVWGEGRGIGELITWDGRVVSGDCQKAAAMWCVLNRYDAGWSDSIIGAVAAPSQFHGYSSGNPIDEDLLELAYDVLDRWNNEKHGETDVGRVLPADYFWFHGDGRYNHFRNEYNSNGYWDWSLGDVYGS